LIHFFPPEQVFALLWSPEKELTPPAEGWGFFNRHFGDYCTGGDIFSDKPAEQGFGVPHNRIDIDHGGLNYLSPAESQQLLS
jgi:hypothetical protein